MGVLRPAPAVAIALALLGAGGPARGGDGDPDAEWLKARAAAAEIVAGHAAWCGDLPGRLSGPHYEAALALDPENARARAGVLPDASPSRPAAKPGTGTERVAEANPAELASAEIAAYGRAAALLAVVAKARADRGNPTGAAEAWQAVLSLDPGHEEARAALGRSRAEKGWLRTDLDGPSATARHISKLAERGAARMPAVSDLESPMIASGGEALYSKYSEARFSVKSHDPKVSARDLLEAMLRTEAVFEGTELIPARTESSPTLLLVQKRSEASFEAAIDGRKDRTEAWKAESRAFSGIWWEPGIYLQYSPAARDALDSAAHSTAHFLLSRADPFGWCPQWLTEGAAYLATSAGGARPVTTCAEPRTSLVRRDLSQLGDWDDEARDLVRSGDDPPLGPLFKVRINALSVEGSVKCRSLVAWLLAASPKAPARITSGWPQAPSPEDLFLRVFGAPPEAVDRRWRLWALRK